MIPRDRIYRISQKTAKKTIQPRVPWSEKVMILLTLLAVFASSYFSYRANEQTKQQLKLSGDELIETRRQLKLAEEQFKDSKKQDSINQIEKKTRAVQEQIQYERQNAINRENLDAMKLQGKIAEAQYESQNEATRDQTFQNRPIFILYDTGYNQITQWANFYIKNVGKRPAKFIRSEFVAMNFSGIQKSRDVSNIGTQINEQTTISVYIRLKESMYKDPDTYYYLAFEYKDPVSNKIEKFIKYFHLDLSPEFSQWNDLDDKGVELVDTYFKKYYPEFKTLKESPHDGLKERLLD